MTTFGDLVEGADIMLFIDSQAAEGVLISGYSSSPQLTALAAAFWQQVRKRAAAAWVGRVPSLLNPADGFSREDESLAGKFGWAPRTASLSRIRGLICYGPRGGARARRGREIEGSAGASGRRHDTGTNG